jgi:hypothetical protein
MPFLLRLALDQTAAARTADAVARLDALNRIAVAADVSGVELGLRDQRAALRGAAVVVISSLLMSRSSPDRLAAMPRLGRRVVVVRLGDRGRSGGSRRAPSAALLVCPHAAADRPTSASGGTSRYLFMVGVCSF